MRSQGPPDHASQDQMESWPASLGYGPESLGSVSLAAAGPAWSEHSSRRQTEPRALFFWVFGWLQELDPGTLPCLVPGTGQGWERNNNNNYTIVLANVHISLNVCQALYTY